MATFDEQTDLIVNTIRGRTWDAEANLDTVVSLITQVRGAILSQVERLASQRFDPDLSGVDTSYVPTVVTPPDTSELTAEVPTLPDAPDMPTAGEIAIPDATWNQIYLRAQGLQDRISVRREWEASNLAAAMGHAQLSESQAALLRSAQDEDDQRASDNALASATEQQKAEREDVVAVARLLIENYAQVTPAQMNNWSSKWKMLLDNYAIQTDAVSKSEQTRLEYEKLELAKQLDSEKSRAEFDLKRIELANQAAVGQLVDLVQVYAQITNSLIAGSGVGLSTSTSIGLGPVTYNPDEGQEIVWP